MGFIFKRSFFRNIFQSILFYLRPLNPYLKTSIFIIKKYLSTCVNSQAVLNSYNKAQGYLIGGNNQQSGGPSSGEHRSTNPGGGSMRERGERGGERESGRERGGEGVKVGPGRGGGSMRGGGRGGYDRSSGGTNGLSSSSSVNAAGSGTPPGRGRGRGRGSETTQHFGKPPGDLENAKGAPTSSSYSKSSSYPNRGSANWDEK